MKRTSLYTYMNQTDIQTMKHEKKPSTTLKKNLHNQHNQMNKLQKKKTQLIITWVSDSGKSSIMDELIKKYPSTFKKPIQFTTRAPRNDEEFDSYVFLTKPQFYTKLENGDFIEFTEYNWNLYGISSVIDCDYTNYFIVEPVWRAALKKHFLQNNIPFRWYFLELDKEDAMERMINRWDSKPTIEKRLKDFDYFLADSGDKVLDASNPIKRNVDFLASSFWAS